MLETIYQVYGRINKYEAEAYHLATFSTKEPAKELSDALTAWVKDEGQAAWETWHTGGGDTGPPEMRFPCPLDPTLEAYDLQLGSERNSTFPPVRYWWNEVSLSQSLDHYRTKAAQQVRGKR